jgi:hypothetical protein
VTKPSSDIDRMGPGWLCGALLGGAITIPYCGGLPALGCAQEDAARSRIARSTALGSVVSKSISLTHSGVIAMRAICL